MKKLNLGVSKVLRGGEQIKGERLLVPTKLIDTTQHTKFTTNYDTSRLMQQNPTMKYLLKEGYTMKMTSAGHALFEKDTGWLISYKEKVKVQVSKPGKSNLPRIEILEIYQNRFID